MCDKQQLTPSSVTPHDLPSSLSPSFSFTLSFSSSSSSSSQPHTISNLQNQSKFIKYHLLLIMLFPIITIHHRGIKNDTLRMRNKKKKKKKKSHSFRDLWFSLRKFPSTSACRWFPGERGTVRHASLTRHSE